MSLGKVLVFSIGAAAGILIGCAATKSETVKSATKASIKAGLKAKDWTVDKYEQAKGELKSLVREAKNDEKQPA